MRHPCRLQSVNFFVDEAIPVSHEFNEHEYQSNEHLTDEEVEAIVKRYGESQSGGSTQPTVKDVAEALHVDQGVVAQLLSDVRSAKTQEDLKSRLDALEAENTELRVRAEKSDYDTDQMWDDYSGLRPLRAARPRTAPRLTMTICAIVAVAMFAGRGAFGTGSPIRLVWLLLGACAIICILKCLRRSRR